MELQARRRRPARGIAKSAAGRAGRGKFAGWGGRGLAAPAAAGGAAARLAGSNRLPPRLADGTVDAIAFTSSPQVQRLFNLAAATRREDALRTALHEIQIGAVGPVVAEELRRRGFEATITPDRGYFMKPLVSAFLTAFSR